MLHLPGWFLGQSHHVLGEFLPEGTTAFSFPVVHQCLSKPACIHSAPVQQLCQAPLDLFVLPPEAPLARSTLVGQRALILIKRLGEVLGEGKAIICCPSGS